MNETDSLLLTREQTDALRAADADLRARLDSIWDRLAAYLAAVDMRYDASAALTHAEEATDAAWLMTQHEADRVRSVLSPVQWSMLPAFVSFILNAKEPIKVRMSSSG